MFLAYSKGVVTVWMMGSFSSCPKFRHLLSNCLSSLSSLIISRSCLITIIKSIWIIPATQSSKALQMTTTTTTRRGNLPTLVLKTSLRFVLDHHRLVFLHIETLFLLLIQKDNVNPCEICGPGFLERWYYSASCQATCSIFRVSCDLWTFFTFRLNLTLFLWLKIYLPLGRGAISQLS